MAKQLGAAIVDLLEHDRVDLRVAAATVLGAVGKGDKTVEAALTKRLADADALVRRLALDGLVKMGADNLAVSLVPLLRSDDDVIATRAAELLGHQGGGADGALRKELGHGPVPARRVMAQLLLKRPNAAGVDAVLDQLADPDFGEQALQLLRAELDAGADKLAGYVEKAALTRISEDGREVKKAWAKAMAVAGKPVAKAAKAAKATKPAGKGAVASAPLDPSQDPVLGRATSQLGALLRLVGYMARPTSQTLLLAHTADDHPKPVRLAAIAALRRIVAAHEGKSTEVVIARMIEFASDKDPTLAHAAVETLRGARIPEKLAKEFASLAKSPHPTAQRLAMERMPAGSGSGAVKALIEAVAGDDPSVRDAAARGLAKAPEAVLPVVRALIEATDEAIVRRYAGVLRTLRASVSTAAIKELAEHGERLSDKMAKGKASADVILLERSVSELLGDVAPAKHVEILFDRARRLRKAGKVVEAFGALKPLLRTRAELDAAIDDDNRFLLALLAVLAVGEGVLRAANADDPVLAQLARLATSGFPVAKRLAKEDAISDDALYGLGFRLLERKDGAHQGLGAEILEGIIDERPRSKLAKAAKNKLKLAGFRDDD